MDYYELLMQEIDLGDQLSAEIEQVLPTLGCPRGQRGPMGMMPGENISASSIYYSKMKTINKVMREVYHFLSNRESIL